MHLIKRERTARGDSKIGTTGRGIGPAYEDKVARRGLRLGDLRDIDGFVKKTKGVMEFHNFILKNYFNLDTLDINDTIEKTPDYRSILLPMMSDVVEALHRYRREGKSALFEGAQGSLLDIDHGTYPCVTSSNTTGLVATLGTGVGPFVFGLCPWNNKSLYNACRVWAFSNGTA